MRRASLRVGDRRMEALVRGWSVIGCRRRAARIAVWLLRRATHRNSLSLHDCAHLDAMPLFCRSVMTALRFSACPFEVSFEAIC